MTSTGPLATSLRAPFATTTRMALKPTSITPLPDDPLRHEPHKHDAIPGFQIAPLAPGASSIGSSPRSSEQSAAWTGSERSDSSAVSTPRTEPLAGEAMERVEEVLPEPIKPVESPNSRKRRASTALVAEGTRDIQRILGERKTGTQLIEKYCCGGGCCLLPVRPPDPTTADFVPIRLPDNRAYHALQLKLGPFSLDTELTSITPLPEPTILFDSKLPESEQKHVTTVHTAPPSFVQPHAPYHTFSAPVFGARELTKPGADKRTFHFDLDVTDYPEEGGDVDFRVGGAVGICPPNDGEMVDDIFNALGIPKHVRDKPILMKTSGGRWPTIWGDDQPRELVTTRRELLTWCTDIQSTPPTKQLLRLLAEYADAENEKKILMYLSSAEGQASFCDLRTGPHITLPQLLHAFPSSQPPLPALLSVLKQLMPRFYSLSNDPHISSSRDGLAGRRLIEMAVTVHEAPDWHGGKRTGVGSGYLERVAHKFMEAQASGLSAGTGGPVPQEVLGISVPIFRGLMANPLSKEFVSDGPMMLIGAGVGMAPFRGFILNRLKNANCANKVWLVQGVRDSKLDEIYSGELGDHEREIKHVVQSRKKNRKLGEAKYVQDEVRLQADVVWFVINALDGRVFVCGSSHGMGEGVEEALVDVAVDKGRLSREEAKEFWAKKHESGQYITETW